MLETADWQTHRMADCTYGDFSTATDLADYLATTGMPFRQAHEIVGNVVRGCLESGLVLEDLTPAILAEIAPEVPPEALERLSARESVDRRNSQGGPGKRAMDKQFEDATRVFETVGFPKLL
jgi:argininosuccinate lyase